MPRRLIVFVLNFGPRAQSTGNRTHYFLSTLIVCE